MPMYEYECPQCGARSERFVRSSETDQPQHCEACGETVKRVLSASAAVGGCSDGPGGFT